MLFFFTEFLFNNSIVECLRDWPSDRLIAVFLLVTWQSLGRRNGGGFSSEEGQLRVSFATCVEMGVRVCD